jgi:hypothetical protein
MHKYKDILGEDTLQFKPERTRRLKHSWHYIPFKGGRSKFPAQQNAYTDTAFFLVRLMQRFKII